MKVCWDCKLSKSLDNFHKNKYKSDGLDARCKLCKKQAKQKDILQSVKIRNYLTRSLRAQFNYSKGSAKNRGLNWEISFEEYSFYKSMPCIYCNDLFKSPTEHGVGLDRINNDKGYISGNLLPSCGFCNRTRGDRFTVDETRLMIETVIKFKKTLKEAEYE